MCGVSKKFGEWYQKTNKTEDTNKITLLAFKIIAILHNTLLATFIKHLETASKGLFRNRSQNSCHTLLVLQLIVSSVLFVFWYRSQNILDTPHIGPVLDHEKENWRILTNKEIYAIVKKTYHNRDNMAT
jgi:hypothetical protein